LARLQRPRPVDPHLDADDAKRQVCALASKVDIRAEGLQRDAALLELSRARHRAAAEHAAEADAHAFNVAVGHHLLDRLLEHAAKRHALLKTFGNHVGDNCRVALGERISSISSLISGT
jgi:hypothetical protein